MIIIMRGTSCSGKDTFVYKEFEGFENHILSSDNFREMLFGTKTEQRKNRLMFDTMYEILEHRLSCRVPMTVVNSTNLRFKDIERVLELSKKYHTPIMVISIQPPTLDELKRRNKKRCNNTGFFVPETVLEKHYNRYFAAIDPFIKEAIYNDNFRFTEIDQEYNVIRVIEGKE
ncbi:MAG: AAA family ATPase [Nitrosopumilaceae archaeon]|nr:AAA family ATPase [Nitrosopumilaceae archaeon]